MCARAAGDRDPPLGRMIAAGHEMDQEGFGRTRA
jgi:hypothetical protein